MIAGVYSGTIGAASAARPLPLRRMCRKRSPATDPRIGRFRTPSPPPAVRVIATVLPISRNLIRGLALGASSGTREAILAKAGRTRVARNNCFAYSFGNGSSEWPLFALRSWIDGAFFSPV